MFELDDDALIIRKESIIMYFLTFFILFWCDFYWLAVFYAYFGVSLLVFDDVLEEWEQEEFLRDHTAEGMHKLSEIRGESFVFSSLLDILEQIQEHPNLVNDDPEVLLFLNSFCSSTINDRFNYLYTPQSNFLIIRNFETNDVFRFTQHKVKFSELDSKEYSNEYFKVKAGNEELAYEMLKFKSHLRIVNTYLVDSFIASGIYPSLEYDFDLFLYDNIRTINYHDFSFFSNQCVFNILSNILPDTILADSKNSLEKDCLAQLNLLSQDFSSIPLITNDYYKIN